MAEQRLSITTKLKLGVNRIYWKDGFGLSFKFASALLRIRSFLESVGVLFCGN